MRRRVRGVAVVHGGPAEEAPRLRRQGRQGLPARRHRAEGPGLLQDRQPQRRTGSARAAATLEARPSREVREVGEVESPTSRRRRPARRRVRLGLGRHEVGDEERRQAPRRRPARPPSLTPSPPRLPLPPRSATRRSSSGRTCHVSSLAARSRSRGAALVVALVTAAIVAGDLAALHRRAADLGPDRRRGRRHPRPPARHRGRAPPTSSTRAACTARSCPTRRHATAPRSSGGWSRCRCVQGRLRRARAPRAARPHRPRRRRAAGHARDARSWSPTRSTASGRRRRRARHLRPARPADAATTRPTVVARRRAPWSRVDRRAGSGAGRAGAAGRHAARRSRPGAERLAYAQANGVVTLALVPPEDAAHP